MTRTVRWHSLPADFTTKEKNISTYPQKGKIKLKIKEEESPCAPLRTATYARIQCATSTITLSGRIFLKPWIFRPLLDICILKYFLYVE